jgi:hypothetical protein
MISLKSIVGIIRNSIFRKTVAKEKIPPRTDVRSPPVTEDIRSLQKVYSGTVLSEIQHSLITMAPLTMSQLEKAKFAARIIHFSTDECYCDPFITTINKHRSINHEVSVKVYTTLLPLSPGLFALREKCTTAVFKPH